MGRVSMACTLALYLGVLAPAGQSHSLPGTQPLTWEGDLSERMMDGAHRFVERKIDEAIRGREKYWTRDFSSREAYEQSVEPNRQRFMKSIGVVDPRVPVALERFGNDDTPALLAETSAYRVYQVRWPVLENVSGEGLLLQPRRPPRARVVALPDANQTPEQIAGLAAGVAPEAQFARRLAENGFEVLVPVTIDRTARWSGNPEIRMTDQPHREWIYRQAFHMGRHVIGYEVQKVLAAVDWFKRKDPSRWASPVTPKADWLRSTPRRWTPESTPHWSAGISIHGSTSGPSPSIATSGDCCGNSATPNWRP